MGNSIRLLAIDLDGTLLTSQSTIAPQAALEVARISREGVRVVLATARWFGARRMGRFGLPTQSPRR